MRHDILADSFAILKNMEAIGRKECVIPSTKLTKGVLKVMNEKKYVGDIETIKDVKGESLKVKLQGRINDCNIIKPHSSSRKDEFIKYEKRFLPAAETGILIITTSKGIMDQRTAKKKGIGGRLLGFVY